MALTAEDLRWLVEIVSTSQRKRALAAVGWDAMKIGGNGVRRRSASTRTRAQHDTYPGVDGSEATA